MSHLEQGVEVCKFDLHHVTDNNEDRNVLGASTLAQRQHLAQRQLRPSRLGMPMYYYQRSDRPMQFGRGVTSMCSACTSTWRRLGT